MLEAVQTLLKIEEEARAVAFVPEITSTYVPDETARRIAAMQQEMEVRATVAERETVDEMVARVKEIEAEYAAKFEQLDALFLHERDALLERVVHEVLHGY